MSALAIQSTVADLVNEYAEKVEAVEEEIAAFKGAFQRLTRSATVQGTYVEPVAQEPYLYADTIRKNLLKSGWKAIYNRLQIDRLASAKDRQLFERTLADPPELTFDSAKATFSDYFERPRFHILRGLAEVFCQLDPAYKSHNNVRIGSKGLPKRVILTGWGSFHSSYAQNQFQDMVKALAAVRGQPNMEWAEFLDLEDQLKTGDAHMNGREISKWTADGGDIQYKAPDRGIMVRKFQNGNAHVFFDKWALHDINSALAEFYGEVLPDVADEDAEKKPGTAVSKDLQFYWSPPAVVDAALDLADIHSANSYRRGYELPAYTVLEPSCGDGRILDELRARNCRALGFEVDRVRAAEARAKGHSVVMGNFLEQIPEEKFDRVVMNPPFYGRHYVKHVRHALKFLKPGGVLVSILPATAHYDHGELEGEWHDLPVASFAEAGTNVPTGLLRIVKRD